MDRTELEPFLDKHVTIMTTRTDPYVLTGVLRTLDWPKGYGGGNEDGLHPVRFTSTWDHFLSFADILSVKEVIL